MVEVGRWILGEHWEDTGSPLGHREDTGSTRGDTGSTGGDTGMTLGALGGILGGYW